MIIKLCTIASLSIFLFACGSDSTPSTEPAVVISNIGPLPGDPVLTDELTGDPLPAIVRVQLAFGGNNIPFSSEIYNTKRLSLNVKSGISYSIDIQNRETSSSTVTTKMRTDFCPQGASGVQSQQLPVQTTRSFEYTATQDCELIFDIDGVKDGFHQFFVDAHLSVANGLLQDPSSHEPNNTSNSAFPVEGGAQYFSTMGPHDDVDYFSINVTAGQSLNLSVPAHASDTNNPLRIVVLGNSLTPLTQTLISTTDSSVNTSITPGFSGIMFLKFDQSIEGTPRSYSFTITPAG